MLPAIIAVIIVIGTIIGRSIYAKIEPLIYRSRFNAVSPVSIRRNPGYVHGLKVR